MSEDPEIAAMRSILEAMSELEEDSRKRVVQWLMNREGISSDALGSLTMGRKLSSARPRGTEDNAMSLSDFFYSVDPQNDMERAIAVAYYLQNSGGKEELTSQEINDELKHLGYPISNITKALTRAMETVPRLMHQTRKEGTSQQARKKYKITHEGMKFMEARVSRTESS